MHTTTTACCLLFLLWGMICVIPQVLELPFMPFTVNNKNVIEITRDNFHIVQFTDLHMGEADNKDMHSICLMQTIVAEEKPDIVVFSGDQISGYSVLSTKTKLDLLHRVFSVPDALRVPFASIFGNHDDQMYKMDPLLWYTYTNYTIFTLFIILCISQYIHVSSTWYMWIFTALLLLSCIIFVAVIPARVQRSKLLQYELQQFPASSYSQQGPLHVSGVSNYFIRVQTPSASVMLYFFDTGGGRIPEAVHADQVKWFKGASTHQPSLAFMHIAPKQYSNLYQQTLCTGKQPLEESTTCTGSEELLDALSDDDTLAVFVGHDHNNAWCCHFKNMQLCYGQHTGFGGYSTGSERGARIIRVETSISQAPLVSSWVVLKNATDC